VYSFAFETAYDRFETSKGMDWRNEESNPSPEEFSDDDIGYGRHDDTLKFLHLTQVCRQLRNEYRPIYLGPTNPIGMPSDRLLLFFDTFYPGWNDPGIDKSKMSGNIRIINLVIWHMEGASLLPFIRLLAAAPGLTISFCDVDSGLWQHQLQELFKNSSAWAGWLHGVERVSFVSNLDHKIGGLGDINEFQVSFRADFQLPWVDYEGDEDGDITIVEDRAGAFFKDFGFFEEPRFDMDYSLWVRTQTEMGEGHTSWHCVIGES
jgi:hypothetical protein